MTPEPVNFTSHKDSVPQGIHVVAKPIGPLCSLAETALVVDEEQLNFKAAEN